jgi:hypothetical protein
VIVHGSTVNIDMIRTKIATALLAGALSAYAGLSIAAELAMKHLPRQGQTIEQALAGETITAGQQAQEPSLENGVVLSSNKDMSLAALAVSLMQQQGFDNAHIMEIRHKGQKYYRTVVPYKDDKDLTEIIARASDTRYFQNISDAFNIDILTGKLLKEGYSNETIYQEKPGNRSRRLSQQEIDSSTGALTKERYVSLLYKKVQKVYESFWGKSLPANEAKQIIEWVYDDAFKYNVPFLPTLAVGLHESKGNIYAIGDRNLGEEETAHGFFQIRKPSIDTVMNLMRARALEGLPGSNKEVLQNPRKLAELGVYHFAHCYKLAENDVLKAIKCHNLGFSANLARETPYSGRVTHHLDELESIARREQH